MTTNEEPEKCYHYDKGYCKFKNKCPLYHPNEDCIKNCDEKQCKFRHRRKCRNGENCFFKSKSCEYVHVITDLNDVTLADGDNKTKKAHKVILAEMEQKLVELKSEIEQLKNEIIEVIKTTIDFENDIAMKRSSILSDSK